MRRFLLLLLLPLAARAEIKDRIAAVVNGQPITLSELEDRHAPDLARASPAERQDILRRAVQEMVDEKLVEHEASSLGLDVPDDELQQAMERLARQNGMDLAQFKEAVGQQGLDYEMVRDSLKRQQLMYKLLQFKVKPRKVSDEEVQAAYAQMHADSEIEVRARHIFISAPEGAPKSRLQAAQAKADEALRRVRGGESFAKVARDLSDGPSARDGGDLGYFKRGQMVPIIEQAAMALQPGQTSGLLRTTGDHGGYHLVMVENRRKLPPRPLKEVQEEIRTRLASDSILKERENYLRQLRKTAQIDEKL